MSNIQKPAVHLNGSGAKNLLEGYNEAMGSLAKAREALHATQPHPRDYYILPDGDNAFQQARQEHINRLKMLDIIHSEIEELAIHTIQFIK